MKVHVLAPLLIGLLWGCGLFDEEPSVTHTVVRGDTLTKIARMHGVSVDDLREWNALKGDRIDVGQVLRIMKSTDDGVTVKTAHRRTQKSQKKFKATRATGKPCLRGPSLDDLDDDEPEMRASVGLSSQQIRTPMSRALPGLSDCFSAGWPSGVLDLQLTVGCNGLVEDIRVIDAGGIEASSVQCVVQNLNKVVFPAHDMPDGMTFRYPITLSL
jgi:LysM repeat protein